MLTASYEKCDPILSYRVYSTAATRSYRPLLSMYTLYGHSAANAPGLYYFIGPPLVETVAWFADAFITQVLG